MDKSKAGVRRNRLPIRFNLAALLLVTTVACVLLAIFRPIRPYTVVAILEVNRSDLATSSTPRGSAWIEQNAMAALPLVTSDKVVNAALASPKVAELGQIQRQKNSAAWLRDRLRVSYPGDGKIIEFRLLGQGAGAGDDLTILQAVIDAYQGAVVRRWRLSDPSQSNSVIRVIQKPEIVPDAR
ncbi:MAG: hypothetical protein H0T51_15490 [Pirellulales bacterium]|nr:hypothetical protein [Pirellulales bacterium]